jgi:hypothetical protein
MPRSQRTIFVSCTGYPPRTIEEVFGFFLRHTRWCDLLLQLREPRSRVFRLGTGVFAEYEKGRLVAKLRSGWERKRKETGKKVGGGNPTRSCLQRS